MVEIVESIYVVRFLQHTQLMHGPIASLLFLMWKFKCFVTLDGGQNYLNADWM